MARANLFIGSILLGLGIILSVLLYVTAEGGTTIKLFMAGPSLALIGIAMLSIAKGPEMSYKEFADGGNQSFLTDASMKDKIIWAFSLIGGIVIVQFIFPFI